jgi:hypothetical protein
MHLLSAHGTYMLRSSYGAMETLPRQVSVDSGTQRAAFLAARWEFEHLRSGDVLHHVLTSGI